MAAGAQVAFSEDRGGQSLCFFAVISPLKSVFDSLSCSRTCNCLLNRRPTSASEEKHLNMSMQFLDGIKVQLTNTSYV